MENKNSKRIQLILSQIKNITRSYDEFFKSLSGFEIPFRDAMIEDIYHKILFNNKIYSDAEGLESDLAKIKKPVRFEKEQYFERMLSQISGNPKKKGLYIQEFLNSFEDISDADKKVILNSFLKIEGEAIKVQMENLMSTFKFSI